MTALDTDLSIAPAHPDRALTVGEQTILVSDRPGAPIIVGAIAAIDGRVDAASLREAALVVLARHPMARARLHPGRGAGLTWQFPAAVDVDPVVDGHAENLARAFEALVAHVPDLTASPPLRVGHLRLPDRDAVGLVAHHAAMDGSSVLLLLRDILGLCVEGTGPVTDGDHLGRDGIRRPDRIRSGPRWPARGRVAASTADPSSGYGVHTATLPVPARPPSLPHATVNDLLLAALHLGIGRWNVGLGRTAGDIRIRMPVDQRSGDLAAGDLAVGDLAVGNWTGQALIGTSRAERRDPAALLGVVMGRTAAAKAAGAVGPAAAGAGPVSAAGVLGAIPAGVRLRAGRAAVAVARPVMMPTATLSNPGRLDGLWQLREARPGLGGAGLGGVGGGGARVGAVHFAAFAGLPQGLAVGATGHAGLLHLTFSYHLGLFDRAAAERFADFYLRALGELTRV